MALKEWDQSKGIDIGLGSILNRCMLVLNGFVYKLPAGSYNISL